MEDHFLLFPVVIIVGIIFGIWYTIKFTWITLGLIFMLLRKGYKKVILKEEGVNNNVIR